MAMNNLLDNPLLSAVTECNYCRKIQYHFHHVQRPKWVWYMAKKENKGIQAQHHTAKKNNHNYFNKLLQPNDEIIWITKGNV